MSLNGNHTGASGASTGPRDPNARSGRLLTQASAALLVVAWPVVMWYVIGDLSESHLPPSQSDYMMHPPPIPDSLAHVAGVGAILAVVVSVALLIRQVRHRLVRRSTWVPVPLLLAAGLVAAFTERVVTAATIGANIGGGILFLIGIPTVLALVVGGVIFWLVYFNQERRQ